MKNSEKISEILAQGHYAVVRDLDDNTVCVCLYDREDSFICTYWKKTLKESLEGSGNDEYYGHFDDYNLKITALPCKPKLLKVGDMVKILKITREVKGCGGRENMVGKICEIGKVYDDGFGVFYVTGRYTFPAYCVRKAFPEELEQKKVTLTLKQVADKFNLDVNNLRIKK